MRTINTTSGPVEVPKGAREHVVNTSDILEPPQMQYVDEPPAVEQVLNAAGWAAIFEDGHREDLIFWCVLDDASVHGVVLGRDGLIDLTENAEDLDGFQKYGQANTNHKEEK